ncbi:hypothetical protein G6F38_011425 [Rhizopus arrhizus]|nr:hypothetical protein G6F38_011425 [Rhizopus arrhizus]
MIDLSQAYSFAYQLGDVRDWSYTIELQDRGSPHVHMVLWTGKSSEELVGMESLVIAQIPSYDDDPELYRLVTELIEPQAFQTCRFGYPKPASDHSYFNPITQRAVYRRSVVDGNVNGYNPYLLKLLKVSMDIQINSSGRVLYYLAKYLSKIDTPVDITIGADQARSHFKARQVGAVDAAYFLCGWNKHRSSRGTVFISTVFPGEDERCQLRTNIGMLALDDTNIFSRTHLEKFLNRHDQVRHLCMVEYFTTYILTEVMDVEDKFGEGGAVRVGVYDRGTINQREEVFFSRTAAVMDPKVCQESNFRQDREVVESVLRLRESLRVVSETAGGGMAVEPQVTNEEEVMRMLQQASTEQLAIYQHLCEYSTSVLYFVFDAAGTGKSFLLNLLRLTCICDEVQPVVLAPTDITAQNVQGETIHRFFGFSEHTDEPNLVRLQDFVKTHKHVVFLIDECSMISKRLLETMSRCLQSMTGNHEDFRGAIVVCFGDAAQLPPMTAAADGFFFQSTLTSFAFTYQFRIPQRQDATCAERFLRFLADVRSNNMNRQVIDFIQSRMLSEANIPSSYVRLFTTRAEVTSFNREHVSTVVGRAKTFYSIDEGPARVLKKTGLVRMLKLKLGVQCLLIDNLNVSTGWVNGTQCVVESMSDDDMIIVRRLKDNRTRAIQRIICQVFRTGCSRCQFPLILSFAATVHKVQSLTLSGVAISLVQKFRSAGQFYMTCSRDEGVKEDNLETNALECLLIIRIDCLNATDMIRLVVRTTDKDGVGQKEDE